MSSIYYTVEGIGVTASSIAPFVNPEKVIECIKKLHPSDLKQIENDTKDINDIGDLEKIVDGYICLGWYYSNICEMLACMNVLFESGSSEDEDYLFYPRKYPWEMKKDEPKTIQKVHEIIIDTVLLVCDMTREQNVTWMYYNPDSNAGGQYVTSTLSFDEIKEAAKTHKSTDDFFDYLGSIADQTLADVGTEWFEEAENAFSQTPDYTECAPETMEALIETTERSDMVATNIGKVPIEDYREIVAVQNGFDSYDEMYNEGIRIGNGYDKEPEPIVPAWEKKKKEKVKQVSNYG